MRMRVLNLDGSLRFMLFLNVISSEPIEDEPTFTGDCKFSPVVALNAIEKCFNEGVQSVVWDRLDDAIDDEEEGSSGSESD